MDTRPDENQVQELTRRVRHRYEQDEARLPFHGWVHIQFVREKSIFFAHELNADALLVESAALVHDVNYFVDRASGAAAGARLRREFLTDSGYPSVAMDRIEQIVLEAETHRRGARISLEAMALSDADTLYKSLPVTPVLLAPHYMSETGLTIEQLAHQIVRDQVPLDERDLYFYSEYGKVNYLSWAQANLRLWLAIDESLRDPMVRKFVADLRS